MTNDDLDNLMAYLYTKGSKSTASSIIVKEHFKNDEINNDPVGLFMKLDKDGYVDKGTLEYLKERPDGITVDPTYKLSFEGRLLYENSSQNRPYWGLKRKANRQKMWTVAKTVITILNSVAILYLMWKAIPS